MNIFSSEAVFRCYMYTRNTVTRCPRSDVRIVHAELMSAREVDIEHTLQTSVYHVSRPERCIVCTSITSERVD